MHRPGRPARLDGRRHLRARLKNAVAFGALFPGEEVTYHKTNENWALESIWKNYQILANAIEAL